MAGRLVVTGRRMPRGGGAADAGAPRGGGAADAGAPRGGGGRRGAAGRRRMPGRRGASGLRPRFCRGGFAANSHSGGPPRVVP
jgi:hypothetical protein